MRRRQFLAVAGGVAGSGCLSLSEGTPTGTRPGPASVTESGAQELVQVTTDAEAVKRWSLEIQNVSAVLGDSASFAVATDNGVQLYGYESSSPRWESTETATSKALTLSNTTVYGGGLGNSGEGSVIYRLNRESGEAEAQRELGGALDTLDFVGDLVICTSHVNNDSATSSYVTRIRGLDPDSLTDRWVQEYETDVFSPGVARVGGTVYLGFHNFFVGLGASDGSQQYRAPIRVGYPVAHEGALLADADGRLRRIDPATLSYDWSVGSEVAGRPVVVGDIVAVPTEDGVVGANVSDGQELWTRTFEDGTVSQAETLAYHRGILWYAADETLYGLLPETGETAFSMSDIVQWVDSSPEGVVLGSGIGVTIYTVEP